MSPAMVRVWGIQLLRQELIRRIVQRGCAPPIAGDESKDGRPQDDGCSDLAQQMKAGPLPPAAPAQMHRSDGDGQCQDLQPEGRV